MLFRMLEKYKSIVRYLINSVFVTILDISIVWFLNIILNCNILLANSCGVIVGTIVDYYLTAEYVFDKAKGKRGFIIYILTFLLGLILANTFIYIGNTFLFTTFTEQWNFLLSKGLSIIGPFFILYNIRKKLYMSIE